MKLAPTFDVTRVLGALLAVVGLIFALKWIGRRFFPNVVAPRGAGIVRVLARTPVSTKQQVVLVQVGKRVIVAADNGAQLTSLSEISDADEVAAILGQLSNDPISKERFGAAFVTAQNGFDEKLGARTTVPSPAADSEDEEADESITSDETDVAAAKGELEGLMNKIRGLAKQLGRT